MTTDAEDHIWGAHWVGSRVSLFTCATVIGVAVITVAAETTPFSSKCWVMCPFTPKIVFIGMKNALNGGA